VTLFRVSGIPIRFHFTFLILAAILIFGRFLGTYQVIKVGGLFASVLLHELGHALTALRFGVGIVSITMYPIGGVARLASQPTPWQELWITIMGPVVNLVIAGALYAVQQADLAGGQWREVVSFLITGNIILFLFNMLPAFPMDGGRLLRAVIALSSNELKATRIASGVGQVVAVLMAIFGLFSGHILLLFIAFLVFVGAQQERLAVESKTFATGVPVSAAMVRDYRTLSHGSTIGEAAQLLLDTTQQEFPVLHGRNVVGLLHRPQLIEAMRKDGPDGFVAAAMNRDFVRVPPDMDLAEALPSMQQAKTCALVMEGDELRGLLTLENIGEFFALRAAQSRQ
jgi:Zn-dependent protease/CBS domain-containing protein